MSIFDRPGDLLPGLLPAAFRGVPFHVVNASHEVGRRIAATLFPGLDPKAHEDLGRLDGPVSLTGLVIGDDYVQQAETLRQAFQTRGPGTLLHPWLGEMLVVLEGPARISFSVTELRVARFEVKFDRTGLAGLSIGSTLGRVIAAIAAVTVAAQSLIAGTAGARGIPVMLWSAARSTAGEVASIAREKAGRSRGASQLLPALEPAAAAIVAVDGMPVGLLAADALARAVVSVTAPIVDLCAPTFLPAIGMGGVPTVATPIALDARAGASLMLAIARDVRALETSAVRDRALSVAAEAAILSDVIRLLVEIPFESRQDAIAWRNGTSAALQAAGARAADLANDNAALAGQVWRSLETARAALIFDLHEIIGRLPSVRDIEPPGTVSAFLLAQHLVGDDPSAVVAMVDDIVRRNRLRHPGSLPLRPIEVLL